MKNTGFVLIELAVVFGILAVLIGMSTINIFGSRRKATVTASLDTLVADLRSQQTKAMTGTGDSGGLPPAYGVHFETNQYVLFRGASYSAALSSNAVIPLDSRVNFTNILFSNGNVIFASRSGEYIGYELGHDAVSVRQIDSGDLKTIQINQYGIISSIN
jgi:type II secretory pathway pseudopilin PulG